MIKNVSAQILKHTSQITNIFVIVHELLYIHPFQIYRKQLVNLFIIKMHDMISMEPTFIIVINVNINS